MNISVSPEEAHRIIKGQVAAMREMLEVVQVKIEDHDPDETAINFNFDLCEMVMENVREWHKQNKPCHE